MKQKSWVRDDEKKPEPTQEPEIIETETTEQEEDGNE
jgi:hypothetical protein